MLWVHLSRNLIASGAGTHRRTPVCSRRAPGLVISMCVIDCNQYVIVAYHGQNELVRSLSNKMETKRTKGLGTSQFVNKLVHV